jgi:cyclase
VQAHILISARKPLHFDDGYKGSIIMWRFLGLFTVLLLTPLAAWSQAEEGPPVVTSTALTGSLYLLQGKGGNVVASIGEDGILIIDDDYAEYAAAYLDALKALARTEGLPKFVINTHWHSDHVGTNAYWGERGAVILAHTNVRRRMSTRQEMKALNRVVEPSPGPALPVVTYDDSLSLHFNGNTVDVRHLARGHTDGDSIVFFRGDNVVHMGDHYFKDRFPFVDLGSGGNVLSYTANVAAVLAAIDDATVIVPGHGALADRSDLTRYHHMLETTTALIKSKLAQGLSVEAIAEQGLGPQWDSWGQGFINTSSWIGFVAGSL